MSDLSPAVDGSNYLTTRPFAFAFAAAGGASVDKALVAGCYYLVAETAPCLVAVGTGAQTAVAPQTTQQAASHASARQFYCAAGAPQPLDIEADGMHIAALGTTATTGTLYVIGPIGRSQHG